jgi:hypothetical protein
VRVAGAGADERQRVQAEAVVLPLLLGEDLPSGAGAGDGVEARHAGEARGRAVHPHDAERPDLAPHHHRPGRAAHHHQDLVAARPDGRVGGAEHQKVGTGEAGADLDLAVRQIGHQWRLLRRRAGDDGRQHRHQQE